MSRKHFVAIADDFNHRVLLARDQQGSSGVQALLGLATDLCWTFSGFNGHFDRGRFLTACGFTNDEISR